jgi:hypothetical protein
MAGFWDTAKGIVGGGIFSKKFRKAGKDFLMGTPEEHERMSTLLPEQQGLFDQLQNSAMNQGAGGAFGTAADYYRDLLSDDSKTAQAMFAPETRNFNENIIPGLSEQFAGMGAGGLSSSGFRNAAVGAGTDLSERLGAIRANLRQQGAAGLTNIGQLGLGNYSQDVMTQPGTTGFLSSVAPAAGQAIGSAFGGDVYNAGKNMFSGQQPVAKKTSPYGNQQQRFV